MYHKLPVILILIFSFTGCGVYTFNPKGKSTISSIAIERFENQTGEFGLEDRMTDQIINAFIADGTIKVVPTENAEAVLVGTLTGYDRQPYNPNELNQVESYSVRMFFDIKLINPVNDSTFWSEKINQEGVYNLATQTEEDGQMEAIDRLVEYIINKTTKSW